MTYSSIFKSVAFGPKLYRVFTSYELISKIRHMVDYVTSILFDQNQSGGGLYKFEANAQPKAKYNI